MKLTKDRSFDSNKIDDPFIMEAFIPEEYNLQITGKGVQLANRNELRHPVGVVAARSLRYFSTNGERFNVFRSRCMAIWWLRRIYNSFNWWKAYVVNAEGERKDLPMLFIGEEFGTARKRIGNEVDIVLSAFENDQCIVNQKPDGGTIFSVGYSERYGFFNSPDMYCAKTIVASKYQDCGVKVTQSIRQNLRLMAEYTLRARQEEASVENISEEIRKIKVVVLDRPRHGKLIATIRDVGSHVILVKDDDLSPTLAVARNEVDIIVGVGGIPEAVLSAIIIENLGGEISVKILPENLVHNEELLKTLTSTLSFKKKNVDILKKFGIVRPGTECIGEIPWDKVLTSKDLVKGNDSVFTASIIKKTPWIKFPNDQEIPGVHIDPDTGNVTVHTIRIVNNSLEIVPIIYKTSINRLTMEYRDCQKSNAENGVDILLKLSKSYAEFGLYKHAEDCIQKILKIDNLNVEMQNRCNSVSAYISGLNALTKEMLNNPKEIIGNLEKSVDLEKEESEGIRPRRIIKRFYEYVGDKNCIQNYQNAIDNYRKALNYNPHELQLYRKINAIEMRELIGEYFNQIDLAYQDLNYRESSDWNRQKLEIALKIFNDRAKQNNFSCRAPWLIFLRRTVLHGEKPSYKLALLIKLMNLFWELNRLNVEDLSRYLNKEYSMDEKEIEAILEYRQVNKGFYSLDEFYRIKEINSDGRLRLLLPDVQVESENDLEESIIPKTKSDVEAMEQRHENLQEELRVGVKEEAQEYSYALAESYHYVGMALYDIGDDDGAKIYYNDAIKSFQEIIDMFNGITPVYAQFRIGNLYEELAILFNKDMTIFYKKAIEFYIPLADDNQFVAKFGRIMEMVETKIRKAKKRIECLKKELLNIGSKVN